MMYLGLFGLALDVYTLCVHLLPLLLLVALPPSITFPSYPSIIILSHTQSPHSHDQFRTRVNTYTVEEERKITPVTFAHFVSSTLYERRIVVVGLEPMQMLGTAEAASAAEGGEEKAKKRCKPFTASTDRIRCMTWAKVSLHSFFVLRRLRHRVREAIRYR
jgi:hypothetical protein